MEQQPSPSAWPVANELTGTPIRARRWIAPDRIAQATGEDDDYIQAIRDRMNRRAIERRKLDHRVGVACIILSTLTAIYFAGQLVRGAL